MNVVYVKYNQLASLCPISSVLIRRECDLPISFFEVPIGLKFEILYFIEILKNKCLLLS